MVSGKLETVSHKPREVSKHAYTYIKEEGGRIDGLFCQHAIVSHGLEIPLMIIFRNPRYIAHKIMKDFMIKLFVMTRNQSQKM